MADQPLAQFRTNRFVVRVMNPLIEAIGLLWPDQTHASPSSWFRIDVPSHCRSQHLNRSGFVVLHPSSVLFLLCSNQAATISETLIANAAPRQITPNSTDMPSMLESPVCLLFNVVQVLFFTGRCPQTKLVSSQRRRCRRVGNDCCATI